MELLWLRYVLLLAQVCVLLVLGVSGQAAVQLTHENFAQYRSSASILFINFYADWCRFSQQLKPIFENAATKLKDEGEMNILFGMVNCDQEKELCQNMFHISKYPTLKVIRYGQIARREFRGKRSVDGLLDFVKEQLRDPVQFVSSVQEIKDKGLSKAVVGYFPENGTEEYNHFKKAAVNLRDDCSFFAVINQRDKTEITFIEDGVSDVQYDGELSDFRHLFVWTYDQCIPIVREITFQNGEELTEEGLPFLILFYDPDEPHTKKVFKQRVMDVLDEVKESINCVTANGVTFSHPLHHLGKSRKDLPLIAIDSFRHMFVFPNFEDLHVDGKLLAFVKDLHSGKLHREFHNGPDHQHAPASTGGSQQPSAEAGGERGGAGEQAGKANPPDSTFKNLHPMESRYTLLRYRDEL